jgi:low temperature requirement protein LtrA
VSTVTPTSGSRGSSQGRLPHLTAVLREGERVTPLELFFDLVFVLALTQCTTLIAHTPTWEGMLKGLLVLGLLWWSWCGYAWLTSVVDPEEGSVRLAMFAPGAFGSEALLFAGAYAAVRAAHIALFLLASREDAELRHSVVGLAGSTALAIALLIAGAVVGGGLQLGIWSLALVLDMAGPYLFGISGWRLVSGHFAECRSRWASRSSRSASAPSRRSARASWPPRCSGS